MEEKVIEPYFQKDGIIIYCGDAFEIMPELEPVDLVVADPPWNLGFFQDDDKEWSKYAEWLKVIRDLCTAISKVTWIFQSTKAVPYVADLFQGWFMFASVKGFCQMTPKKIPNAFDVAFFNSSDGYCGNGRNWHNGHNNRVKYGHPTIRPLDTIKYILNLYKHKNILDPFLGSGTTLVAAKELGRRAIGIEIEEKYCEIAANRVEKAIKRDRMSFHLERKEERKGFEL